MAIIPKESIFESQTVKPTAFAVWCLLCQVKDSRKAEVYLELETAIEAGIQKSAYYSAFVELESKGWIKKSTSKSAKKMWILCKGFSTNTEKNSANVENYSANAEKNSANVEFPPHPPIRINSTKGIKPKEHEQSAHATAHENFIETKTLVDQDFKTQVDEVFWWILERKNISKRNLPIAEWLKLLTDLEAEQISLDGFKDFYCWCESQDWVMRKKLTITPNLMRNQIENYKNRERLDAKEKIANLGKNNGQTKQSFTDAREKAGDRIKQTNARIDAMRELADRIESQNSVSGGNGRNREGNDFVVKPIAVIAGTVDGNGEGLGEAPF
jgi:hypothetical protein